MDVTMIGIDIAKTVFQLCCVNEEGKTIKNKRLSRKQLLPFLANLAPCRIVMEACGGANYWVREFEQLGHTVQLIAPQFVKPYVKGNKSDVKDAQGIVDAASRPDMKYVTPKTVNQQDWQSLLRVRESYIEMRTKLSNQIRGLLAEYGIVTAKGLHHLRKLLPTLVDRSATNSLSAMMKELLETQFTTLTYFQQKIEECDMEISQLVANNETCQRLMKIEGIGKITAVALIVAAGKDGKGFKNGRHFSAYIGLVPRQHSSGSRELLLGISKRGDAHLRRLLVHGARSALIRVGDKKDKRSCWATQLKERRGHNRACVALANKNARIAMAIIKSGESYRQAA